MLDCSAMLHTKGKVSNSFPSLENETNKCPVHPGKPCAKSIFLLEAKKSKMMHLLSVINVTWWNVWGYSVLNGDRIWAEMDFQTPRDFPVCFCYFLQLKGLYLLEFFNSLLTPAGFNSALEFPPGSWEGTCRSRNEGDAVTSQVCVSSGEGAQSSGKPWGSSPLASASLPPVKPQIRSYHGHPGAALSPLQICWPAFYSSALQTSNNINLSWYGNEKQSWTGDGVKEIS